MAETLGSLCDKLTIVKLKQWHTEDSLKLKSLQNQEKQLVSEIDNFIHSAVSGHIHFDKLTFPANKVYKNIEPESFSIKKSNSIGAIFSELAETNHALWREQEKVFSFQDISYDQKDLVVKQLAILNLKRTQCIDTIDHQFASLIKTHVRENV